MSHRSAACPMMGFLTRLIVLAPLVILLGVPAVHGATFDDPEWPCIQRKVVHLSPGLMWPHPLPPDDTSPDLDPETAELADTLALRRVSLDETATLIDAFAAARPDLSVDDLGAIFLAVFRRTDMDRTQIMSGIARYSLKQIDLSARIESARVEMTTLMAQDKPDFDRVDQLEERLDWDQRIFRDRVQSLAYVCETPVLMEKRIYAIGQQLLRHVPD